jgi:hypothetical protein
MGLYARKTVGLTVEPFLQPFLAFAIVVAALLCLARVAAAQSEANSEPAAILELGPAASRSFTDGTLSFGPSVAVETTPIENWLEIEAGVSPLFRRHSTEWNVDLLFKKPWTLSSKAEFMFGVGPEWIHSSQSGATPNSLSAEAALDFMYWPSGWNRKKRKFGWFVEPTYEYNFARGHEQSFGISGGLLIAIW